jgi:Protein of unknown function (DUF2867)
MPIASVAYQLLPAPDWASTTTVAVADGSARDARGWAEAVFAVGSVPLWVKTLFGMREVVARLLRIPPGHPRMFAVHEVRDGEALIDTDDRHLRFVAGVRADERLLHVTTAVQLKGWRGQLYFLPVRFLHDQITRSMMAAAARRAAASVEGERYAQA